MRKKLSPAKKRRKRNERLKRRKRNDNLSKLMRTRTKYISTVTIAMTLLIHQIVLLLGGRGCSTHRVRKNLELDIMVPLGERFFRRAYRMEKQSFYRLHGLLREDLEKKFFPTSWGGRDIRDSPYLILTEMRLSLAIRFFAGADPYDLMITHGVSYISVFYAVWGVVDVINNSPHFNITFPSHQEQKKIARGFKQMSGANFDTVIGAIDGILIWIIKPSKREANTIIVILSLGWRR